MNISVRIEGLGKRYYLGGLHPGYVTFREMFAGAMLAPFQQRRGEAGGRRETIWALNNVNLQVEEGELVGVIGRNGAGKSTLLKLLSRITRPTKGRMEINGRVGSLLEVGTGFHPDLTGYENIFLSGAILGMRKAEIKRKLDEIVAFSEIEQFIDTPVKWYSSGMYVRLAFSVAAHLEPEILMMDEVLAVGDAGFQQKCLNKMRDIRSHGRTILFVSHNMPAVMRLCKRVLWIERGEVVSDGTPQSVVGAYLRESWNVETMREWKDPAVAPADNVVRLRRVRIVSTERHILAAADIRQPLGIEIEYEVLQAGHQLSAAIDLSNEEGVTFFHSTEAESGWQDRNRPIGKYTSTVWIPGNLLAECNLLVSVSIVSEAPTYLVHAYERNAVGFQAVDNPQENSPVENRIGPASGAVRPGLSWTTDLSGPE
jgi:lipopolysaccharide transport system ATP-binding protein